MEKLKVLKSFKRSELGMYDSGNGKSVKAYKVVDVTPLCKKSKQCVIKYANVIRGVIAQICDWSEPGKDLGVTVHYHINEMTAEKLAADEVFQSRALSMGALPFKLAQAIFDNK